MSSATTFQQPISVSVQF